MRKNGAVVISLLALAVFPGLTAQPLVAELGEVVPLALFGASRHVQLALSPSTLPNGLACTGQFFEARLALGNAGGEIEVYVCEEAGVAPRVWVAEAWEGALTGGRPQ